MSAGSRRGVTLAAVAVSAAVIVGGIFFAVASSLNSSASPSSAAPASSSPSLESDLTSVAASSSSAVSTSASDAASSSALKGPQDSPAAAPTATASDGRVAVTPLLTTWSFDASSGLFAGALVSSVVVDDGSCTLTASLGGRSVSASGAAEPSAEDTFCSATIPAASLTSGTWSITMAFASGSYVGTSAAQEVVVP